MKKVKVLLVVSFICFFFANGYCRVSAEEVYKSGDFEYVNNYDGTITISNYTGTNENVVVPSEIDGKKVTIIGRYAFFENKIIQSVSLPEGLLEIREGAFGNLLLPYQVKIYIPDSVIVIDENAFKNAIMVLSGNVYYLPMIVANPDSYAKTYADSNHLSFSCIKHSDILVYCESIAPTYTTTGRNAGYFCSVCGTAISGGEVIPTLKYEPIKIAIIPEKGSTVTVSNAIYKITNSNTKNCTVEYSKTKTTKKNLTIPSTVNINGVKCKVTSVAKNVCKNNKKIKKVTIGNNVTKINASAFKGCKNLKTIIIKSKKLKYIGKNAFKGISPKAKIKVPAKKLKAYKKLFKKKGLKPTVKIVKI